ncbi:hypothetical protein ACIRSS_15810 [Amycolatopsis sp. NPDC101161]|uniref:hypothetical protein n=1 Tax=Amycolatopsis sp. NPDC101161 TaxID=3363940 RepID=UPI00380FD8BF
MNLVPGYVETLHDNLQIFLEHWGPIDWRGRIEQVRQQDRPEMAVLLAGLSGIEDDSFYMQNKLKHSGSARLDPVRQFNSVWLVEEADHGRALAALARKYTGDASLPSSFDHSTFHRDRRSIVAVPALRATSLYRRGALAAYFALGTTVEYIAVTTYKALARTLDDEIARDILMQMSSQEGRHMRFYRKGAIAVMSGSVVCQRFVREVLEKYWRPPGVDLFGYDRWVRIFRPLLQDNAVQEGYLRLDEICGGLPGLSGIEIMKPFMARCARSLEAGVDPRLIPSSGVE